MHHIRCGARTRVPCLLRGRFTQMKSDRKIGERARQDTRQDQKYIPPPLE